MKEEDTLLKKLGKEHPFKVPEGYFENFTSEMMEKLPELEQIAPELPSVSLWTKVKPLLYMAAMFIGAALIIRALSVTPVYSEKGVTFAEEELDVLSEEMIDMTLDRVMMDDYSLYVYLNDSDIE